MVRRIAEGMRSLAARLGSLFADTKEGSRPMNKELEKLRAWQEDLDRRCGC